MDRIIDEEQFYKMQSKNKIIESALRVLDIEAKAIVNLKKSINKEFVLAVNEIIKVKGRLIVIAVGKSGHIGRKIAATLSSTGTPSIFVHPTEALHGDLGMITKNDIVLAISNSGESDELSTLLTVVKKSKIRIIGLTGNQKSTLAKLSDILLLAKVEKEADPNNLAPTSSTTATLALGDALAVSLLEKRSFTAFDFAKLHPGGNIGRSLLQVKDIMHMGNDNPVVDKSTTLKDALITITLKGLGVVSIVDSNMKLQGILTDGDIRRLLLNSRELNSLFNMKVGDIMSGDPLTIFSDTLCVDAVHLMEDNRKKRFVSVLPVIDRKGKPVGMIHMHDLIRRGFSFANDNNKE